MHSTAFLSVVLRVLGCPSCVGAAADERACERGHGGVEFGKKFSVVFHKLMDSEKSVSQHRSVRDWVVIGKVISWGISFNLFMTNAREFWKMGFFVSLVHGFGKGQMATAGGVSFIHPYSITFIYFPPIHPFCCSFSCLCQVNKQFIILLFSFLSYYNIPLTEGPQPAHH